jgi:prepilin-type N-terminal cleavage/methylation domain-containing protein
MDGMNVSSVAPRSARRAGFTLIEIMIAMVLLAIGVLSMLALQTHAMRGSQLGRHYGDAAQVARDEMETILRQDWDDMDAEAWTAPEDRVPREVQIDGEPNAIEQVFQVSHRIVDDVVADPVLPTDVRTIDVRVTWYEPNDDPAEPPRRRYAMTTSRFNDGN